MEQAIAEATDDPSRTTSFIVWRDFVPAVCGSCSAGVR
jgi:hypothetical protein